MADTANNTDNNQQQNSVDDKLKKQQEAIQEKRNKLNEYNKKLRDAQENSENAKNYKTTAENDYNAIQQKLNEDQNKLNSLNNTHPDYNYYVNKVENDKRDLTEAEARKKDAETIANKIDSENAATINEYTEKIKTTDKELEGLLKTASETAEKKEESKRTEADKAAIAAYKKYEEDKLTNSNDNNTDNGDKPIDVVNFTLDVENDKDLPVTNFRLPQWGYTDFVNELDNFRKGVTNVSGEPGWFYFKIFFHFDDVYGLLGSVLQNKYNKILDPKQNTAFNYLAKRSEVDGYFTDNLGARAHALERFILYLSYINSYTPWFFDKVNGLDKAVVQTNELTKERSIEISCLEDAVDMRLTTLFHMYQYACYDEINQKEIIPDNLRKFNMSVVLYHVPIKYIHTNIDDKNGKQVDSKSLHGTGLRFDNRMSYKMFTFKGCEFDLNSLGQVIPSSIDNAKPFNLGKNTIKITYDRCFTHIMNEWEQIMYGPEGIYYDPKIILSQSMDEHKKRFSLINNALSHAQSNESVPPVISASIIGESFVKYADTGHSLGNIYNINMDEMRNNMIEYRNPSDSTIYLYNIYDIDVKGAILDGINRRNRDIYLSNIYNYNPGLFRALVLQKNVPKYTFALGGYKSFKELLKYKRDAIHKNTIDVTDSLGNVIDNVGTGHGLKKLPDFKNLGSLLPNSDEHNKYYYIYNESSKGVTNNLVSMLEYQYHNANPLSGHGEHFRLLEDGLYQLRNRYGTLYAIRNYHDALNAVADTYMTAWQNLKGSWNTLKNTYNKNMWKGINQEFQNVGNFFKW